MPKKKKIRKKTSRKSIIPGFLIISGVVIMLILVFVFKGLLGSNANTCANSISCINDLSGTYQPQKVGVFMGKQIAVPLPRIAAEHALPSAPNVLGESTGVKHIYVDLTHQRLIAYQGGSKVFVFPISSGKWHPTPTGDFHIWIKLRYTRMTGGSGEDFYDLPNVPYVMFFYNDDVSKSQGFSIHGAYWHDNFGYPMSHGCINMRPEDAAKIFEWATPVTQGATTLATDKDPGTEVTIYGQPPE